ncbi:MAG: LytTR family DNA-binding domain-containing protein [Bacteroidota bacterium]
MFLQAILKQPYPLTMSGRHNRIVALCSALFMLSFLSIFQPFQLRFYPEAEKVLVILSFTLITGLGLGLNLWFWPRYFSSWFDPAKWSIWREGAWISLNLLILGGGAFCFKVSMGFYPLNLTRILTGLGAIAALGAIPVAIYELIKMVVVKSPLPAEAKIQAHSRMLLLDAQRGEEHLHIQADHILVISSDANYVDILWKQGQEGELQQTRLRATLRHVETQLEAFPDFVRCHRAHIANLARMRHFCGNQQGGKLYIAGTGLSVPVSRRYVPVIQAAFLASQASASSGA